MYEYSSTYLCRGIFQQVVAGFSIKDYAANSGETPVYNTS